jgi:mRNA interferase RelE/StbE
MCQERASPRSHQIMTYDVFLHKKAQKNLEKFSDRERIRTQLRTLEQFPDSGDLIRIEDGIYRMRIGEYRALFKVYDDEKIIVVINVDVRGKVYKSL